MGGLVSRYLCWEFKIHSLTGLRKWSSSDLSVRRITPHCVAAGNLHDDRLDRQASCRCSCGDWWLIVNILTESSTPTYVLIFTYSTMASERRQWSANVKNDAPITIMQYCPARPYLEISVPSNVKSISRLTIITVSHDQGLYLYPVYLKWGYSL